MKDDLLAPPLAVAGVEAEQELLLRPQAGQGEGGRGEGAQVAHQLTALQLCHHGCEHLERSLGLHTGYFGTVLRLYMMYLQLRHHGCEHLERSIRLQDILERSLGFMISSVTTAVNTWNSPYRLYTGHFGTVLRLHDVSPAPSPRL
jgi:hypothetical protein